MYRIIFYSIMLMGSIGLLPAQTATQMLRGTVTDKESSIPLPGVRVLVLGTTQGAMTDDRGNFSIPNVEVGRHDVQASMIGYENATAQVQVISGKEAIVSLALIEKIYTTDEAVISVAGEKAAALNDLASVSARQFTIDESRRYAGARDDVSRMAANFAGVAGGNSGRNDIVIRGNSPLGMLWRLEGIDIPNPNHFGGFGTTGGPVSMLNNNVLANSDFLTGAFPATYGNASAGVFDLRLRNGNSNKHEFLGQFGFNGFELGAEGPISKAKGSSYLANYRYSTLGLFKLMGISFGVSGLPQYQDAMFHVNLPTTKYGTFSVFGLGGTNNITFEPSTTVDTTNAIDFGSRQRLQNGTTVGVLGITHKLIIGTKSYTQISLSTTYQNERTDIDTLSWTLDAATQKRVYSTNLGRFFAQKYTQQRQAASFIFNHKANTRLTFRTGLTLNRIEPKFLDSVYSTIFQQYIRLHDIQGSTYLTQLYGQAKYRASEKLTLFGGAYSQHFSLNGRVSFEPRLSATYQVAPKQTLSLAFGRHAQLQPMPIYFQETTLKPEMTKVQTNKNLDYTYSNHFVAGYDITLGENFRIKTEAYYQRINKAPVTQYSSAFSMLNYGADFGFPNVDSLVNKGEGQNYGIELTIEKFFSKHYYFLLTNSLFDSRYKASDGVWRSTAFNTRFISNALFGYELPIGKNNVLAIDMKQAVGGGRRYTPIDVAQSAAQGKAVYDTQNAWSAHFKTFQKTDITLSFRKNGKRMSQRWALQVENVLGIKNPFTTSYDPERNKLVTQNQLGRFIVGQYKIEF